MIRAKHMRTAILMRGEVTVDARELEDLRRKARAHDAYVQAVRWMRERESIATTGVFEGDRRHWRDGWLACLREFGELVLRATREAA